MSNIISDVVKIKYNTFTLAPAMLSYYETCQVKHDNMLLMYLLFPVVLNSDWICSLPKVQSRSRLEIWVRENRLHIEGLSERIKTFQHLTETTLQYCIDMEYVKVDEYNNVMVLNNPYKKDYFVDAAIRLTKLLGKSSPAKIYATLGIKELTV